MSLLNSRAGAVLTFPGPFCLEAVLAGAVMTGDHS